MRNLVSFVIVADFGGLDLSKGAPGARNTSQGHNMAVSQDGLWAVTVVLGV